MQTVFQLLVPHHFHNVAIEAVVGCKGYDATEDGEDAQEPEAVDLGQPHPALAHWRGRKDNGRKKLTIRGEKKTAK